MEKNMKAGDEKVKINCAKTTMEEKTEEGHGNLLSNSIPAQKRPRGWKAMPYILANESFERLATLGLTANLMVYLLRVFHLKMASAANVINIWVGVSSFTPLIGGFISDAYTGRFKTIAFGSFACLLGMIAMTLTAGLPQLHPPKCDLMTKKLCKGPNDAQTGVLLLALGFLSIGTGGIRPCSIPFGVDQFDQTTEQGVKGMSSFFNIYYIILTSIVLISKLVVVYIQDSVSWMIGFGIPSLLMFGAIVVFFIGKKVYVIVAPQGSVFSGIAQVFVAAYKKRHLNKLPQEDNNNKDGLFYDPPPKAPLKLPFTNQLRFFNKAAMIGGHDELHPDGTPIDPWSLCSIQQVEEVKCVIKILPISASSIVSFISITQQSTFIVSQALKMDRHLGPNNKFEIPAGSIVAITYLTIVIWVLFYDRILVPALRKITKLEGGIKVLQRCGIGNVFSILSMVAAGLVEKKRRDSANLHIMWLTPPLVLMGLSEGFGYIGLLEFYNKEFPDGLKSIGNSLIFCGYGAASYLSCLMVTIIHATTGKQLGRPDWLANDINDGRLDCFYFVIAGMGVLNFIYFLFCARWYRYKEESPCGSRRNIH